MSKTLNRGDQPGPTCPDCGMTHKLVVRVNGKTDEKFLGCPNWPKCKFTQEIPDHIWMEAQGQPKLFNV